ncbi:hypothetical protein OIO90_001992 [Microbotryomycetes sp. JL221]|nr:hypothetical protein OIO90_001992 [Microbotryomycetes sp. JL221]
MPPPLVTRRVLAHPSLSQTTSKLLATKRLASCISPLITVNIRQMATMVAPAVSSAPASSTEVPNAATQTIDLTSTLKTLSASANEPVHVKADLSYYNGTKDGSKPWTKQYPDPEWKGKGLPTNAVFKEHHLPIFDLRPLVDAGREDLTTTDVTGFQVVPKRFSKTHMQYDEWNDENTIKTKYYNEVETLLKNVTGASKVIIFDHTIRKAEPVGQETLDTPDNRKPVSFTHVDQTPASGTARVLRHAGQQEGERLLKGRAQLINVWRPLRGPVLDFPLAYADARTLNKKSLIPSDLLYEDRKGETLQVEFSDQHRWYYLSSMQPDEAVLLKCWENTVDGQGGNPTPHTAFVDERYFNQPGVELRQSIEIRALVFHESEQQ